MPVSKDNEGEIISNFLLKKMTKGEAKVILPEHYTMSPKIHAPGKIIQGNLIYFFRYCNITLNFKIEGDIFANELLDELRGAKKCQ